MKIQVITNGKQTFADWVEVNTLNAPMSFDDYDLNIIDLTSERLWNTDNWEESSSITNSEREY